jgi:Predicted ATPase
MQLRIANSVTPIKASVAKKLPQFHSLIGSALKINDDAVSWKLSRSSSDIQAKLFNFHYPILRNNNLLYLYDPRMNKEVEIDNIGVINSRLDNIKNAYQFSGSAKVDKDALLSSKLPSIKHSRFAPYNGKYQALHILDEFFQLDASTMMVDADEEDMKNQMRLAFLIWGLQHVARLKGMGDNQKGDVAYSLVPILISTYKGIGKSSFLNHLLSTLGSVAETDLDTVLNPTHQGRLFAHHTSLILNELSPFAVTKNIEAIKQLATSDIYTVDEKFEKAVDLRRETALIATSNRPAGDFAQYQSERRLQLITILPKQNPTAFEDSQERFEQFWAELDYITDALTPREVKALTNWGTNLTLQPEEDGENTIFDFLRTSIKTAIDNIKTEPDVTYKEKLNEYQVKPNFLVEQAMHNRNVLESLGIKTVVDNATGGYQFSEATFNKRMLSKIEEFYQVTKQLKPKKTNTGKVFVVTDKVDETQSAKEGLDTTAMQDKLALLAKAYQTVDYRTRTEKEMTTLGYTDEHTVKTNPAGRLSIVKLNKSLSIPEDVAYETFEEYNLAYVWYSDDNREFIDSEVLDFETQDFSIYTTSAFSHATSGEWQHRLSENTGIGWLITLRNLAIIDAV